ncbi:MAG: hypothetical protein CMI52_01275 [Parcubacteria group bacterium]|nr:hypothetical protein [Parcubacteria group bacterium]|tara:strand:- start:394 stop:687 length:294 start_codon:yes stop_codon:yes gene_type:complete
MNIAFSKLNGFHVETQSGMELGKVSDCIIDKKTHSVTHYEVKGGHLGSRKTMLVHTSQVIKISRESVIVKDGVSFQETKKQPQKTPPLPQGILSSDS